MYIDPINSTCKVDIENLHGRACQCAGVPPCEQTHINTVVFFLILFVGVASWEKLLILIVSGFLFKVIYAFVIVYPTAIVVKLLKKYEQVKTIKSLSYNPFL